MGEPKPARLRYYIDADILGLAKVLMLLRTDVTHPADPGGLGADRRLRPPCPIDDTETWDDVWIPLVAHAGWIVITKDKAIGETTRLRDLANEHGGRLVAIASRNKLRTWDQLRILMAGWERLEALSDLPGPWMYRAFPTGQLVRVEGVGDPPRLAPKPRRPPASESSTAVVRH